MSDENAAVAAKRGPVSLPFLVIVGALAVGAYFAGPWVMARFFLQQEAAKASGPAVSLSNGGTSMRPAVQMGGASGNDDGGSTGPVAGGEMDPAAIFARRDADENGKLEGDEIHERMASRLTEIDTDGDGAISEEEFVAAMQSMRSGGQAASGAGETSDSDDSSESESNS